MNIDQAIDKTFSYDQYDLQYLIDEVLNQICADVRDGDLTAIEELLRHVSVEHLQSFLPEKGDF
jgi:hypothetical protein